MNVVLYCPWEGDKRDAIGGVLAALFGPINELLRSLSCV